MSTTTIEDQLAEVRRQIAGLEALGQTFPERARIQRHLDALHHEEAAVLAAAREAPDEVEEKLGQLRTRLAVAQNSVFADVSDEWATFAAAVEDELRSWGTYLERLQATAAAKAVGMRASGPRRRLPTSAPSGSRSTTAWRRRARTSTAPGTSRGTTSARLAKSSNGRPPNCRAASTERSRNDEGTRPRSRRHRGVRP